MKRNQLGHQESLETVRDAFPGQKGPLPRCRRCRLVRPPDGWETRCVARGNAHRDAGVAA